MKARKPTRREQLVELHRQDRANRCLVCFRALEDGQVVEALTGRRFCSLDCVATADERAALEAEQ